MNHKSFRAGLIALAGAAAMIAGAAQANILANGDFSSPNDGGGYSQTTSIPGWFSVARTPHGAPDTIEVGNSNVYGLPCINENCQNLELNSNTFGEVFQVVGGLDIHHNYQLTWNYAGRAGSGPQYALVLAYDFRTNKATVLGADFGSTGQWNYNVADFRATSPTELLLLFAADTSGGGGAPSLGNEFTNFDLEQIAGYVPEPATWATMLMGVFGLGAVARAARRKARAAA